jgi:hypothetical protein
MDRRMGYNRIYLHDVLYHYVISEIVSLLSHDGESFLLYLHLHDWIIGNDERECAHHHPIKGKTDVILQTVPLKSMKKQGKKIIRLIRCSSDWALIVLDETTLRKKVAKLFLWSYDQIYAKYDHESLVQNYYRITYFCFLICWNKMLIYLVTLL